MSLRSKPPHKKTPLKSALRAARPSLTLFSGIFLFVFAVVPIAYAGLININTAAKAELMSLKGIGEVKAQAIIDYREARGPFRRIEDIMKVKGIGPATFATIKASIEVGDVPPPPPPSPRSQSAPVSQAPIAQNVATPPTVEQAAAVAIPVSAHSDATPLWWYILGVAAIVGLGIAGALYAKLAIPAETGSRAREFEIID